jgi:hypothetical protein
MARTRRFARLVGLGMLPVLMGGALQALVRAEGTPASATFHVSGRGKDSWTGTLPEPNAAGTDGPFATPTRARDAARRLRAADKAGPPGAATSSSWFTRGATNWPSPCSSPPRTPARPGAGPCSPPRPATRAAP